MLIARAALDGFLHMSNGIFLILLPLPSLDESKQLTLST